MSDTDPETPQVKALFAIDARDAGDVFEGWHDPAADWNGWAQPSFDKTTTLKIIAWVDAYDGHDSDTRHGFTWEGTVLVLNEADNTGEHLQCIEPDPDGRYPIGAGSLVWDVIEIPDGEELGPWLRRADEETTVQRDVSNLILDRANDAGYPVKDLNRLRQSAGDRAVSELRSLRPNDPHAPLPPATIHLLTGPDHTPTPAERARFTWAGLSSIERSTLIDLAIFRATDPPDALPDLARAEDLPDPVMSPVSPCDGDDCVALTQERTGGACRVDAGTDHPHTCPSAPAWIRTWVRTQRTQQALPAPRRLQISTRQEHHHDRAHTGVRPGPGRDLRKQPHRIVRQLAQTISDILGDGWSVDARDDIADLGVSFLDGPHGVRLMLSLDGRDQNRLQVQGPYPGPAAHHHPDHEISVRHDRGPTVIGADIVRRLLPAYLIDLTAVQARARAHAETLDAATSPPRKSRPSCRVRAPAPGWDFPAPP